MPKFNIDWSEYDESTDYLRYKPKAKLGKQGKLIPADTTREPASRRVYLTCNEKAPHGEKVYEGAKGGRYYYPTKRKPKGNIYANIEGTSQIDPQSSSDVSSVINKNTYALGDIHGDFEAAVKSLQLAGIINKNHNWIGGTKNVVQVGDLTDRGDKGIEVIKLFMRLEKEAEKAGGKLNVLMGNHDAILISAAHIVSNFKDKDSFFDIINALEIKGDKEAATCLETFVLNGGQVEEAKELSSNTEMLEWMSDRPMIVRREDVLYTHADGEKPYLDMLELSDKLKTGYGGKSMPNADIAILKVNAVCKTLMRNMYGGWYIFCDLVSARGIEERGLNALFATFGGKKLVHGHSIHPRNTQRLKGKVQPIDNALSIGVQQWMGEKNRTWEDFAAVYKIKPPDEDDKIKLVSPEEIQSSINAVDESELDDWIGEDWPDDDEDYEMKIQKAEPQMEQQGRVYLKPGMAPPEGAEVFRGKRGGQYYIASEHGQQPQDEGNGRAHQAEEAQQQEPGVAEELNISVETLDDRLQPSIEKFKQNMSNLVAGLPPEHTEGLRVIIEPDWIDGDKVGNYDSVADAVFISVHSNDYDVGDVEKHYDGEITGKGWKITLLHEIGHRVSYKSEKSLEWFKKPNPERIAVSEYGATNQGERFAEAYLYYILNREKLHERDPEAEKFVEAEFGGTDVSPDIIKGLFSDARTEYLVNEILKAVKFIDSDNNDIDEFETVASNKRIPKYGYGTPMTDDTSTNMTTPPMVRKSNPFDDFINTNKEFKGPAFFEYTVCKNKEDRDAGELQDLSAKEVARLAGEFNKLPHKEKGKWLAIGMQNFAKEFGAAASTSTPTFGRAAYDSVEMKKKLQERINNLTSPGKIIKKSTDFTTKDEEQVKEVKPKTELQKKILGKIDQFERKGSIIKQFLDGYEKLAMVPDEIDTLELEGIYNVAKSVKDIEKFDHIEEASDGSRLDKVIFVDSVAHNLHQQKFADGSSIYKKLDELADISKSLGESDRMDRLIYLKRPTSARDSLEALSDIDIIYKSESLEKGTSFWKLFEKAIKAGVKNLTDAELVLLREWVYAKV